MQTLSEAVNVRKLKVKSEDKDKDNLHRRMELLALTAVRIKDNLTPSQVNIKSHSKDLFTSIPSNKYNACDFQQKTARYAEQEKSTLLREKTGIRFNVRNDTDIGIRALRVFFSYDN
jgi:hypothetical protein